MNTATNKSPLRATYILGIRCFFYPANLQGKLYIITTHARGTREELRKSQNQAIATP